jgi:hypothetical protein
MKKGQTYIKDISGFKKDMITVISFSHTHNKRTHWHCLCECGNKCILNRKYIHEGRDISCGCRITYANKFKEYENRKILRLNSIYNLSHWERDCLIWDGYSHKGNPSCTFLNVKYTVRRLLWLFHFGEIPKGKIAISKCLNKKCINIKHIGLEDYGYNRRKEYRLH